MGGRCMRREPELAESDGIPVADHLIDVDSRE
jgi:hypothetical protein